MPGEIYELKIECQKVEVKDTSPPWGKEVILRRVESLKLINVLIKVLGPSSFIDLIDLSDYADIKVPLSDTLKDTSIADIMDAICDSWSDFIEIISNQIGLEKIQEIVNDLKEREE